MFLKLRITFTILSALCLVGILPAAVWGGWLWFTLLAAGALCFFALMLVCKQSQEKEEEKTQSKQKDFLSSSADAHGDPSKKEEQAKEPTPKRD